MSKPTYISYSGASRYKQCPAKFFLAKRFSDKRISSAFPFGKAIEMGVSALLEGKDLFEAKATFEQHWNEENVKGSEYRQIFDNLDLQFYASDFDKNLLSEPSDDKKLNAWAEELLGATERSWLFHFDELSEEVKSEKDLPDEKLAFYNRVIWECCRIRGNVMLDAFHEQQLPNIDLTKKEFYASQKEVSMTNNEGDKITGYVDYVVYHKTHGWVILDLKTAGQPYAMHALNSSEQLRTYVAALGNEIGSNKAGYLILLKKIKADKACNACGAPREGMAKKCKSCGEGEYSKISLRGETQLLVKEYQDSEIEDLLEDYANVTVAIKNGVNFKNPGSCNSYGRVCEYFDVCWNKKDPTKLAHLEDKGEGK